MIARQFCQTCAQKTFDYEKSNIAFNLKPVNIKCTILLALHPFRIRIYFTFSSLDHSYKKSGFSVRCLICFQRECDVFQQRASVVTVVTFKLGKAEATRPLHHWDKNPDFSHEHKFCIVAMDHWKPKHKFSEDADGSTPTSISFNLF